MYSNKKLVAALMVSVLLFSAAGCSDKPTASSSETIVSASSALPDSSSSSAAATTVDSPKLEPVDPILVVYSFLPDSKLYTKLEAGNVPATLLGVVNAVAKALELPDPQVTAITQQKGMVSVDFDQAFLDSYGKRDVYRFFDSLGMTLSKNHHGFGTIAYTLAGDGGVFGDGPWNIQPLKLIEGDAAAFKEMRSKHDYSRSDRQYNSRVEMGTMNTDPVAKTIADLLSAANVDGKTFASPTELPAKEVVQASIAMTQGFASAGSVSYPGYPTSYNMEPIYAAVSLKLNMQEDMVWVQEHVEQSAKLLFGPDFVIEHQSANKYTYFAEEGVYTPPHMGAGFEIYTAVHDYTDSGDTVTATVSYAMEGMGGISAIGDWEKTIAPEKLVEHLKNDAVRHTVTLRKNADGSMYIVSQQAA